MSCLENDIKRKFLFSIMNNKCVEDLDSGEQKEIRWEFLSIGVGWLSFGDVDATELHKKDTSENKLRVPSASELYSICKKLNLENILRWVKPRLIDVALTGKSETTLTLPIPEKLREEVLTYLSLQGYNISRESTWEHCRPFDHTYKVSWYNR